VPSDAPRERVRGIVDALIAEGLVVERRGVLTLP
jgi:(2Fe-2S) ferredoxin